MVPRIARDFSIRLVRRDQETLAATAECSAGEATEELDAETLRALLPASSRLHFEAPASPTQRQTLTGQDPTPRQIGSRLFDSLFVRRLRELFFHQLGEIKDQPQELLRLLIRLDPSDSYLHWIQGLPWELLFHPSRDFLAKNQGFSIVRSLDAPRPSLRLGTSRRFRCLAIGASPRGFLALNISAEFERLRQALTESQQIQLVERPAASETDLEKLLSDESFEALHFIGHGARWPQGQFGVILQSPEGHPQFIDSQRWADLIANNTTGHGPQLVVLNACSTAEVDLDAEIPREQPFLGVAQALVAHGIPAVLAMSRPLSDRAALEFTNALYRALPTHPLIDSALAAARRKLGGCKQLSHQWATPVLFLRGTDGRIFETTQPAPITYRRNVQGQVQVGTLEGQEHVVSGVSSTSSSEGDLEGTAEIDRIQGIGHRITGVDVND